MKKKFVDPVRDYGAKEKKESQRISNGVDEELYQRVSRSDLILFAIFLLSEKGKKCTFEELIGECFLLFPQTFSFSKFPKWPDSRRLDRALRSLRAKKLIVGDPKTFFSLTKYGKKTAEETAKIFRQKKLKL